MKCKGCGNSLPDNAKFCGKCGAKVAIERKCTQCGNLLASDNVFCMECGTKYETKTEKPAPKAPVAKKHRFRFLRNG